MKFRQSLGCECCMEFRVADGCIFEYVGASAAREGVSACAETLDFFWSAADPPRTSVLFLRSSRGKSVTARVALAEAINVFEPS